MAQIKAFRDFVLRSEFDAQCWAAYLGGALLGLGEAWLMRGHYLFDADPSGYVPRWLFVLGLAHVYGTAVVIVGLVGLALRPLFRWAIFFFSVSAATMILFLQIWLRHYHVARIPDTRIVLLALCVAYGLIALTMGAILLSLILRGTAALLGGIGVHARRGIAMAMLVILTVGALAAFQAQRVSPDLRILVFQRIYLTGVLLRLTYRVADFDGDGFAPRWIGGDDPNNFDSTDHPLARVEPFERESPALDAPPQLPHPVTGLLLITIDTLRADHLGSYGYERSISPRLDRLAEEGVRVRDAISQWSETSESMATVLTGTYPHTHGVLATRTIIADDNLLLAEILHAAGFRTAAFVHNGNLSREFNFDQGFETYLQFDRRNPEKEMTDAALAWFERHLVEEGDTPFLLWIHYVDPHGPYQAPEPYADTLSHEGRKTIDRHLINPAYRTESSDLLDYIDRYDEELHSVDAEVGRLLDALSEARRDESTLVTITSDHGESFEHHYFADHGRFSYDSLIRVPLIYRLPGVLPAGRLLDGQVSSVDLLPTVLDLLGLEHPPDIEGFSYASVMIRETEEPPRRPAFTQSDYKSWLNPHWTRYAMRTEEWKYVWAPGQNLRELYYLPNDPGEVHNLVRDRPRQAAEFHEDLTQWVRYSLEQRRERALAKAVISDELRQQLEDLGYLQ